MIKWILIVVQPIADIVVEFHKVLIHQRFVYVSLQTTGEKKNNADHRSISSSINSGTVWRGKMAVCSIEILLDTGRKNITFMFIEL